MSHQTMRVNLASVIFPFTKDLWGRSVIVPQYDENYERSLYSSADIGKEKGVAMACYLHNCMPTSEGYQSIGFSTFALGFPFATDFDRCFQLLQSSPNNAHFLFVPADGRNYIYDATVGAWAAPTPFPPGLAGDSTIVTTAYAQGDTYIFYQGIGAFRYDQVNKALAPVTLTGLSAPSVVGITESFGYMIAWSTTTIAWSSAVNPLDFTPSLITGAGGGNINDVKGSIILAVPTSGGFVIFCEKNVVSAKYTGNIRFPFIFKEISNSGGIESPDQVAVGANSSDIYAWTSSGLQTFTLTTAEQVFPEATDFLAKLVFEDFDDILLTFTETILTSPLNVKVSSVSDRYVVISYGTTSPDFTHAIIYDTTIKRWGKVKVLHRASFQWNAPNLFGMITYGQLGAINLTYGQLSNVTYGNLLTSANTPEVPLKSVAFLQKDGTVLVINMDYSEATAKGTMLLGKFQFQRNKFIVHQWTDVENVTAAAAFSLYIVPTLNGKDMLAPVLATKIRTGVQLQRWAARLSGQNYSLLMIGAFNLTSVLTDFTLGGDR